MISKIPSILAAVLVALVSAAHAAPDSFAFLLQAEALGKNRQAAVARLAQSGRDWIVLDSVYSSDERWQQQDLITLRQAKPERKIIAYISIGEAEDYRPYWKKEWGRAGRLTAAAPAWLGRQNPQWKGNYRVSYWDPAWQAIIFNVIDTAMADGFDGVYLDIVDGFETFELDGKNYIENRVNPATSQTFRRDMVDFVKQIADRVHVKKPLGLIIPQNGSELLGNPDFVAGISGIGIEDLFTETNRIQDKTHTADVLANLLPLRDAGKPVLDVEYPTTALRIKDAKTRSSAARLVWLVTDRNLKTLGTSGK